MLVIAPDLPGHGDSDPLPTATFDGVADAIGELLEHLDIGPRYLHLHDWGAPVGLQIAMQAPGQVLGQVVQNANAHRSGRAPGRDATRAYWTRPDVDNEAAATAHLTLEGTRDTYLAGLPAELAARIPAAHWQEDWRVMNRPGHVRTQRERIADHGRYAERFDAIADYLARWQPRAVLVWGRHDVYFDIAEVLSWMRALPRMQAHVLDGGHLLLEMHGEETTDIILSFIATH